MSKQDALGPRSGVVDRLGKDDFFANFWQKRWCHTPSVFSRDELATLIDLEELDRLVLSGGLSSPNLQLLQGGRAVDIPVVSPLTSVVDTGHLLQSFAAGCGFRIQHLQNYLHSVAGLCHEMEREFGHPVRANAYFSPKDSSGLAPHYDSSEAFILQVLGSKHWKVYPDYTNRVDLPLYEARSLAARHHPIGEPEKIVMQTGDMLYMPRGQMHAAFTNTTPSIHVTFAILGVTWIDLLGSMMRQAALQNVELRRLVPLASAEKISSQQLASVARSLFHDIPIENFSEIALKDLQAGYSRLMDRPEAGALAQIWQNAND